MEYVVKKNKRKLKRDVNKVFSNNLNKILTEIILNADDSYKRLEQVTNDDTVKPIIIDINRKKKVISICDYAEGMSETDIRTIFTDYGGVHNKRQASSVRGLFGQGASDVLFYGAQAARLGKIESIKNGEMSICKFIIGDEQKIKVDTVSNKQQIKNFKDKHKIIENGTVVTFGLGDKVSIPYKKNLKHKIESFYMLRYVLSDSKRKVIIQHDKIKEVLDSNKFIPNAKALVLE